VALSNRFFAEKGLLFLLDQYELKATTTWTVRYGSVCRVVWPGGGGCETVPYLDFWGCPFYFALQPPYCQLDTPSRCLWL